MRMIQRLIIPILLIGITMRAQGAGDKNPPASSLQEITRQAEERLMQWDAEDDQEQRLHSRYWWVGIIQLAASIACGHPIAVRAFSHSNRGDLPIQGRAPH